MSDFTVEEAETMIGVALAAGDMQAVEFCLGFIAGRDPYYAQFLVDEMKLGIDIRKRMLQT